MAKLSARLRPDSTVQYSSQPQFADVCSFSKLDHRTVHLYCSKLPVTRTRNWARARLVRAAMVHLPSFLERSQKDPIGALV
jgi:hypothetical protein